MPWSRLNDHSILQAGSQDGGLAPPCLSMQQRLQKGYRVVKEWKESCCADRQMLPERYC